MSAIKKIQNFSYALSDEIGLGLTSKVFKGKNDITGTPVAIKCVDLKTQNDHLSQ
jgi:RIO-like serine/threonine protein kinase